MSAYSALAPLYDKLMEEKIYTSYVERIEQMLGSLEGRAILDIGCGTGRLGAMLIAKGAHVTGYDLSSSMIETARRNVPEGTWYVRSMEEIEEQEQFDAVVSTLDVLNYASTFEQIETTFARVAHSLKKGGVFLFDIHSEEKYDIFLYESPFVYDDEMSSYIWTTEAIGEYGIRSSLLFYTKREDGTYDRTEETHEQTIYPLTYFTTALQQYDWSITYVEGDVGDVYTEENERYFICVTK